MTLDGISIFSSDSHLANDSLSIVSVHSGKLISFNDLNPLKHRQQNFLTKSGMII